MKNVMLKSTVIGFFLLGSFVLANNNDNDKPDCPKKMKKTYEEVLNKLDLNKDGLIGIEEAQGPLADHFKKADLDKDGFINKEEFEYQGEACKKGSKGDFFNKMDFNQDGKISFEESSTANQERFQKKDLNNDGFITKEEIQQEMPSKEKPSFEELLEKMDANQDGLLAKEEVKGPLQNHFDEVDLNKDGLVTKEEFQQAPAPSGKKGPNTPK